MVPTVVILRGIRADFEGDVYKADERNAIDRAIAVLEAAQEWRTARAAYLERVWPGAELEHALDAAEDTLLAALAAVDEKRGGVDG